MYGLFDEEEASGSECPCADCQNGNPPRQPTAPNMTDDYVMDLHERWRGRQAISHTDTSDDEDTRPSTSAPDLIHLASVAPLVLPWIVDHPPGWTIDGHHGRCGQNCPCCRAANLEDKDSGCDECRGAWEVSCASFAMRDVVQDNGRTQPRQNTPERYVVPDGVGGLIPWVTGRVPASTDSYSSQWNWRTTNWQQSWSLSSWYSGEWRWGTWASSDWYGTSGGLSCS